MRADQTHSDSCLEGKALRLVGLRVGEGVFVRFAAPSNILVATPSLMDAVALICGWESLG